MECVVYWIRCLIIMPKICVLFPIKAGKIQSCWIMYFINETIESECLWVILVWPRASHLTPVSLSLASCKWLQNFSYIKLLEESKFVWYMEYCVSAVDNIKTLWLVFSSSSICQFELCILYNNTHSRKITLLQEYFHRSHLRLLLPNRINNSLCAYSLLINSRVGIPQEALQFPEYAFFQTMTTYLMTFPFLCFGGKGQGAGSVLP